MTALFLYTKLMIRLLLTILFLTGCATQSAVKENKANIMQTFVGKSIDVYIEKNTPFMITPLASGGYKYDFRTIEDDMGLRVLNLNYLRCRFSFITDKEGIIIKSLEPDCR
tara:strand:+ start:67 stop:399 length:333 start_codon:yes stop_codon:yes gene_type:complete